MKQNLAILLTFLVLSVSAQDITFSHPIERTLDFGFNVYVGGQFSNLDKLNEIFKQEGIPDVNSNFLLIGGGMNFVYGNHFLHFKGSASLNEDEEDNNNIRTSASGFSAGINYGYRFYLGSVYAIPYAGITTDGLFIEIQDLPTDDTNIDNQILNRNISKLHNEVLAASLGCRFLIPNDSETLLTGFDFSYQFPLKSNWFNGDFSTTSTPELNVGGFKIGIEILFLTGKNSW